MKTELAVDEKLKVIYESSRCTIKYSCLEPIWISTNHNEYMYYNDQMVDSKITIEKFLNQLDSDFESQKIKSIKSEMESKDCSRNDINYTAHEMVFKFVFTNNRSVQVYVVVGETY